MPLVMDHSQQPPGGYSFPDKSGYMLRGDNIAELLSNIADYRSKNGLSAGNPAAEYEAYCSINHPWLVSRVGTTPIAKEDPVVRWLNRQWRTPIQEWAETETAQVRYGTCLLCPNYVAEHPFNSESKRRLIIMGAGRLREMTGVCRIHNWPVALACAAEKLDTATEVEGCWARTCPSGASTQSTVR